MLRNNIGLGWEQQVGRKGSRRSDKGRRNRYMESIRQDRSAVLGVGLLLYPRGFHGGLVLVLVSKSLDSTAERAFILE